MPDVHAIMVDRLIALLRSPNQHERAEGLATLEEASRSQDAALAFRCVEPLIMEILSADAGKIGRPEFLQASLCWAHLFDRWPTEMGALCMFGPRADDILAFRTTAEGSGSLFDRAFAKPPSELNREDIILAGYLMSPWSVFWVNGLSRARIEAAKTTGLSEVEYMGAQFTGIPWLAGRASEELREKICTIALELLHEVHDGSVRGEFAAPEPVAGL